jgi:hypothetical protein
MTKTFPNMLAPLVNVKGSDGKMIGQGFVIPPWNSWFQQFSQAPAGVAVITAGGSPFSYTPNDQGTVIISGGTVSNISLIRGTTTIPLFTSTAAPRSVTVSIGDTVIITYSVKPTIQFLEF